MRVAAGYNSGDCLRISSLPPAHLQSPLVEHADCARVNECKQTSKLCSVGPPHPKENSARSSYLSRRRLGGLSLPAGGAYSQPFLHLQSTWSQRCNR
eukprot:761262-Hanusia_phi.AAC.3